MITLKIELEIDHAVLMRPASQANFMIKRDIANRLREAYERHTEKAISEDDWSVLPVRNLSIGVERMSRSVFAKLEIPEEGVDVTDWNENHPFGWIL